MQKLASSAFALLLLTSLASVACGGSVDSGNASSSGAPAPTATNPSGPGPTPSPPTPTPSPTPSPDVWNQTSNGCGNFVTFTATQKGDKFVVVDADIHAFEARPTNENPQTIDLAPKTKALTVRLDAFTSPPKESPYCTDIIVEPLPTPTTWTAISGTATVTATPPEGQNYQVTVVLKNVTFRSPSGELVTIPNMVMTNVNVGWLPG
jgi:hypothetical protein